ncbi:SDR family NAD(P)-dependent oxidoreductase [Amycolatopsis vastitatis]|uniref:Short-chain dehydrogenase n=1 Tax=Amycolatopsis vastitatis TaxID=1905142 RepID=A0A229SQ92_9PSEU|nr:SDR family NAD(P)-dependent oxidoreductase [Amycolatopsis vastitatis]OXM61018.1 short-chain dehydrogenase [Amycolatopsis vastitatis]
MPTIVIVGAGPGLGLSIATTFGDHGFDVALISRNKEKLDDLVDRLAERDITAAGFTADVMDRPSLTAALEAAARHFGGSGGIDVLEYSPATRDIEIAGPLDVTPENLQSQLEYNLYGAVTAANAVLPAMLDAGAGTLLFTTGGGSVTPNPMFGNVNAAQAALRNWVLNLNNVLADKGVYAAHVAINVWIGANAPAGFLSADADTIATRYWDLYERRDQAELVYAG